uniref:Peptidyl-tRNA hydrolase 1 homolog n=1 Tax=Dromaius novaehollandiae TaxID=8790 RepID=A0A8C4KY30_DRONO
VNSILEPDTGIVAGLGNYGLRGTRHSVGMAVLDRLAGRLAVADRWRADGRCCGDVAVATAHGVELVLLKPRRLMNLNGLSVASAAKMYNLSPEDIYLVHDDLDKALGKGGEGGENSNEMTRLRVGIGRPEGETTVTCYVLGPFSSREQEMLQQVLAQAATCLLEHILRRRAPRGEPGDRG